MDIHDIDKARKRYFALICIVFSFILITVFSFVDFIEGDSVEFFLDILALLVLTVIFTGIKFLEADVYCYRAAAVLLAVYLQYNLIIGSGNGTIFYWLYIYPLIVLFFLGIKHGGIASGIFMAVSSFVIINPLSLKIHYYPLAESIRFLASLLFVSFISHGLETSREKYMRMVSENHKQLMAEKHKLQKAFEEVRTLSGLIPVCSSCKKIRDDDGYWKQVDIYVKDHFDTDCTHGICPECAEKMYSDLT